MDMYRVQDAMNQIEWERVLFCTLCETEHKEGYEHPMFRCRKCNIKFIAPDDGQPTFCVSCFGEMHILIPANEVCPRCLEGQLIEEDFCTCPLYGCMARVSLGDIQEHIDNHWREGAFR